MGSSTAGRRDEMSFTGTNLSERDLDALIEIGLHVNLDLLSQLDRWGRRAPGSSVGIRREPAGGRGVGRAGRARRGAAREPGSRCTRGPGPTKFGILPEQLDDAIEIAAKHELRDRHAPLPRRATGSSPTASPTSRSRSSGWRRWPGASRRRAIDLAEVNAGGGLGVPQAPGERRSTWTRTRTSWSATSATLGATIACEPGDFLARNPPCSSPRSSRSTTGTGDLRRAGRRVQRRPRALHLRLRRPDRALSRGGRRARARLHRDRQHQRGRRPLGRGGGAPELREGDVVAAPRRRQLQPVDAPRPLPAAAGRDVVAFADRI